MRSKSKKNYGIYMVLGLALIVAFCCQKKITAQAAGLDIGRVNQLIIEEVNNLRAQNGLDALMKDDALMNYAADKAGVQAANGALDHDSVNWWEAMQGLGFISASENLAMSYARSSEEEMAIAFVKQYYIDEGVPTLGHRKNMLNPYMTRIGTGIVVASNGSLYNAMNFGIRSGELSDYQGLNEYLAYCGTTEERASVYDKVDGPAVTAFEIVDDQGDFTDGIITVYPHRGGATYNLQIKSDGVELTPAQIAEVTWKVEEIAGFEGKGTVAAMVEGSNELEIRKSGVVKVTATYKGETTSIDIVAPGDVNRDGQIDPMDTTNLYNVAAGIRALENTANFDKYTFHLYDMTEDGQIDPMDTTSLYNIAAGNRPYIRTIL